jgi:hypothetical protein
LNNPQGPRNVAVGLCLVLCLGNTKEDVDIGCCVMEGLAAAAAVAAAAAAAAEAAD